MNTSLVHDVGLTPTPGGRELRLRPRGRRLRGEGQACGGEDRPRGPQLQLTREARIGDWCPFGPRPLELISVRWNCALWRSFDVVGVSRSTPLLRPQVRPLWLRWTPRGPAPTREPSTSGARSTCSLHPQATHVIVVMGSGAVTCSETAKYLTAEKKMKVGQGPSTGGGQQGFWQRPAGHPAHGVICARI